MKLKNTPIVADETEQFIERLGELGIPEGVANAISEYHSKVSAPAGTFIFRQGSPADIFYFVLKGAVKVTCPTAGGRRVLVNFATAGDIFGLANDFNDRKQWVQRFAAEAVNNCTLGIVTRQHLRAALRAMEPEASTEFLDRISAMWSGLLHHFVGMLGLGYRERLEQALAELGKKFGVADVDGTLLNIETPHTELAEMIGCSRPLVSRIMVELLEEGAIARRGRRYVLIKGGSIARMAREKSGPLEISPVIWPAKPVTNGISKGNGRHRTSSAATIA